MVQSISEHAIETTSVVSLGMGTHTAQIERNLKATLITFRVSRHQVRTLGEKIRKKRLVMGLKQVELASLLGVHEMTIVNWETGKTKPRGRRL